MGKAVGKSAKRLLTVSEVCDQTGFHQAKVYRLIEAGMIKAVDTSTQKGSKPRWSILQVELDRFLGIEPSDPVVEAAVERNKRIDAHVPKTF